MQVSKKGSRTKREPRIAFLHKQKQKTHRIYFLFFSDLFIKFLPRIYSSIFGKGANSRTKEVGKTFKLRFYSRFGVLLHLLHPLWRLPSLLLTSREARGRTISSRTQCKQISTVNNEASWSAGITGLSERWLSVDVLWRHCGHGLPADLLPVLMKLFD